MKEMTAVDNFQEPQFSMEAQPVATTNERTYGNLLWQAVWEMAHTFDNIRTQEDAEGPKAHRKPDRKRKAIGTNSELSRLEKTKLDKAEFDLAHALFGVIYLGHTLSFIQNKRLFRERYGSFEEYLRERWGLSERDAFNLNTLTDLAETCALGHILLPHDHLKSDHLAFRVGMMDNENERKILEEKELNQYQRNQGRYMMP